MSYRKLEINGEVWEYSIGKGAKIRSPKGKSVWVDGWELLGYEYPFDNRWEGEREPITPAVIRKYIEEKLV